MKACSCCKQILHLDSFHNSSDAKDKKTSRCKSCTANANRAWAIANKEKVNARAAAWRARNPEKAKAINVAACRKRRTENLDKYRAIERENSRNRSKLQRKLVNQKYYAANKEKVSIRNAGYLLKHPESRAKGRASRRASELNSTPAWANKFFISEAYHLAKLREKATGFKWHVDHIVPLRSKLVCGLHVEQNLQVIPAIENLRKSNVAWPDMPQ